MYFKRWTKFELKGQAHSEVHKSSRQKRKLRFRENGIGATAAATAQAGRKREIFSALRTSSSTRPPAENHGGSSRCRFGLKRRSSMYAAGYLKSTTPPDGLRFGPATAPSSVLVAGCRLPLFTHQWPATTASNAAMAASGAALLSKATRSRRELSKAATALRAAGAFASHTPFRPMSFLGAMLIPAKQQRWVPNSHSILFTLVDRPDG